VALAKGWCGRETGVAWKMYSDAGVYRGEKKKKEGDAYASVSLDRPAMAAAVRGGEEM